MSELPTGWAESTLGDLQVDLSEGVNPGTCPDEEFELFSVPSHASGIAEVVRGREIGSNKQTVEANAVLLCKINPRINRVWVVEPKTNFRTIASTEWIPFWPLAGMNPRYLAYYLQQNTVRDYLAQNASGVGGSLMRVKPSTFAKFSFVLAPSPEQDRIVAEIEKQFTRLDAATAALRRVQANLKRYRASVLKAACEGRLVPTEAELARKEGRDYEPASELLKRILRERRARWEADTLVKMIASGKAPKDDRWKQKYKEPAEPDTSNLPGLPEGWRWASAEQICDFITKGTTPSANHMSASGGDVPFIKVYNLTNTGKLDFSVNPTFVNQITHAGFLSRSRVFPGDVLMNIVGPPLGKVSVVPESYAEWNVNQAIAIFRPIQGLDRLFLAARLMTDDLLDWAMSKAKATAGQFNLTLEICRELPVPLPPAEEQARIVTEIDRQTTNLESTRALISSAIDRRSRLRQGILRAAFSGVLVPQYPTDEPASALLERIRAERAATPKRAPLRKRRELAHA